jgi:superfamily II DNA or RNA helicase
MSERVHLRPWQRAAFDLFRASPERDFLAVATPGAGKTTFALACARAALADATARGRQQRVVVVAPTSHLKLQWAQAAHRLGLELDHGWSPADGVAGDVHGLVTTYQHVATGDTARRLRPLVDGAFVILDEVHHAGDERAWGTSVRTALEPADRRLALSGTPFRSDTNPIPFVRYAETGEGTEAQPDFTYGYADALRDGGVVRPVYFPRFDGLMEWTSPDGLVQRADFHDELDRTGVAQRLRAALSLDGEWLPSVLTQAHERLSAIREQQPDAGGLAIAADQDHARGIANLIRRRFGQHAEVVVSDDPEASRKIAAFAASSTPWLVAVRMVSEGVDIPRLRVGVYATTVATELFFRQAVGRFVRWQSGRPSQKAYVFIPDDPRLRVHAFRIADARRHVLRPPVEAEDDPVADLERDLAEAAAAEAEPPEQLSLFSVLSAVATGVSVHAFTEDGLTLLDDTGNDDAFDDEPDVPEPDGAGGDVELEDVPTALGYVAAGRISVGERKELLRERNATLTRALVDRTGWTFGRINAELNKAVGITSVGGATNEQLERRAKRADGWVRTGRP